MILRHRKVVNLQPSECAYLLTNQRRDSPKNVLKMYTPFPSLVFFLRKRSSRLKFRRYFNYLQAYCSVI